METILNAVRGAQIRAQFAACGAPLLGDTLYGWQDDRVSGNGNPERIGAERIGLQARRLDISSAMDTFGSENISFDAGPPDWLE